MIRCRLAASTELTEVVIVGAGLAGTAAATILGRNGVRVVLLDAIDPLPYCFRAEKLSPEQVERFERLGLGSVEPQGTFYHELVNGLRRRMPTAVDFRMAKVRRIVTGPVRQEVVVDNGEKFQTRLVIVSSGNSEKLLKPLTIRRRMVSRSHSMAFGFTVAPRNGHLFDFAEFLYKGDHTETRIAFLSLFRIGQAMRANMFAYWGAGDADVREFLVDPIAALERRLPAVTRKTGPLRLVGHVDRCPSHLRTVEGHVQSGVALIGDAFQINCPATATGMTKVLNDVECLCTDHLPDWLSTPGMGAEKIARFYEDPRKVSVDRETLQLALVTRRAAVDASLPWRLRRQARSWKRTVQDWWHVSAAGSWLGRKRCPG